MSRIEKLLERLNNEPKDFKYDEAKKILNYYGFQERNKGKTSGSRVIFKRKSDNEKIFLHKPHPSNLLKPYAVKKLKDFVERKCKR
ncbi:MAG: type II toxin-antitoxin system HicA family toxin [Eubacterium sp.]|nr:type II toxin-antitoxin system HicA family toxin [Eubacterium sp.]